MIEIQLIDDDVFMLNGEVKSRSYRAFAKGDYISMLGDSKNIKSITNGSHYSNFIIKDENGTTVVDGSSGGDVSTITQYINIFTNGILFPSIPNQEDIIRWFQKRDNYTLLDKINNNDAEIGGLVSVFDGVDGVVNTGIIPKKGDSWEYYISYEDSTTNNFIGTFRVFMGFRTADFRVSLWGESTLFLLAPIAGKTYKVNVDYIQSNNNYSVKLDDVEIGTAEIGGDSEDTTSDFKLGTRGDIYIDASMFNYTHTQASGESLFIPLPHLPYGFDSSNNPIPLTVSGGVSLGYDINGSSYLQEKGVVERIIEVITDGDFESGIPPIINSRGSTIRSLDTAFSGIYSGKYTGDGVNSGDHYIFISGAEVGEVYDLSVMVYIPIDNSEITEISLQANSGSGSQIKDSTAIKGSWVKLEAFGIIQETTNLIRVNFGGGIISEHAYVDCVSAKKATPEIIPNTPTGQAAYPIVSGDTFIAGGGMMNLTDCLVRLYEVGDVDVAKTFFDKSNTAIWKTNVQTDIWYNSSKTGNWHSSQLTMEYLYENIQDAYKYQLWVAIKSGLIKDIFLYGAPLEGDDICKAKKYVGVGEEFTSIEDVTYLCDTDNLIE